MVQERVRSVLNEYQLKDFIALAGIVGTLIAVVRTGDRLIWNQEIMQRQMVQTVAKTDSLAIQVKAVALQVDKIKLKYIDRNSRRLYRIESYLKLPPYVDPE